jgi:hypothetical protein
MRAQERRTVWCIPLAGLRTYRVSRSASLPNCISTSSSRCRRDLLVVAGNDPPLRDTARRILDYGTAPAIALSMKVRQLLACSASSPACADAAMTSRSNGQKEAMRTQRPSGRVGEGVATARRTASTHHIRVVAAVAPRRICQRRGTVLSGPSVEDGTLAPSGLAP